MPQKNKYIVTAPMPNGQPGQQRFNVSLDQPFADPEKLKAYLCKVMGRLKGATPEQITLEGPIGLTPEEEALIRSAMSGPGKVDKSATPPAPKPIAPTIAPTPAK